MADEQQSPLLDLGQLMPDPTAVQGAVADQWQARLAQAGNNPIARNQILQQMYGQALSGGDPRVQEAVQQRQTMQDIMQQVNEAAPDNEDPLDYQQRLSTAMLKGMSTVNPRIAIAAAQNLVRIQEARQQRSLLSADTSIEQAKATEAQAAGAAGKYTAGKISFVRPGQQEANGMPGMPTLMATLDANDPNFAQDAAKLQADAQKGGYQLVPMAPDKYEDTATQIANARGNFALRLTLAQQANQTRLSAAEIAAKARGGDIQDFTPDELNYMAEQYRLTGKLPNMGMGGQALKAQIIRMAADNAMARGDTAQATVLRQQSMAANESALKKIQPMAAVTGAYADNLEKNFAQLEPLVSKMDTTGIPVLNRAWTAFRSGATGDPDVAQFVTYLNDVESEFAKLRSGALGNQAVSDAQMKDAKQIMLQAYSTGGFAGLKQALLTTAQNKKDSYASQIAMLTGGTSQGGPPGSGQSATPAAPLNIAAERASAQAAIRAGAPESAVRARFKQRTGQEL